MTGELGTKQLGLLQELLSGATRFAVLANPNNETTEAVIENLRTAALAIGVQIDVFYAGTNRDIDTVFASLAQKRVDALLVIPTRCLLTVAYNLSPWRRTIGFQQSISRANLPRLAA